MSDLDEKLSQLTNNMITELKRAGAIDAKDQVINQTEFNRIIDEKIRICYGMARELETSGKRFEPNDNNKILSTIELLRTIKGAQSLTPYASQGPNREQAIIEKFERKKPFLEGLKNLFGRHRQGNIPSRNHSK